MTSVSVYSPDVPCGKDSNDAFIDRCVTKLDEIIDITIESQSDNEYFSDLCFSSNEELEDGESGDDEGQGEVSKDNAQNRTIENNDIMAVRKEDSIVNPVDSKNDETFIRKCVTKPGEIVTVDLASSQSDNDDFSEIYFSSDDVGYEESVETGMIIRKRFTCHKCRQYHNTSMINVKTHTKIMIIRLKEE